MQSFKGVALTYQLFCFLVETNTLPKAKLDWKKDDYSSVLPSFSTEAVSKRRINSLYFLRQLRKTFMVCCQGTLIPLHSAQRCTCSNIFGSWGLHTVPFMHRNTKQSLMPNLEPGILLWIHKAESISLIRHLIRHCSYSQGPQWNQGLQLPLKNHKLCTSCNHLDGSSLPTPLPCHLKIWT